MDKIRTYGEQLGEEIVVTLQLGDDGETGRRRWSWPRLDRPGRVPRS